jgi:hypothetical protein
MIGRCGFVKADGGRKHTKGEEENPHGNLSRSGLSRQNVLKLQIAIQVFYSRIRDDARRIAANITKLPKLLRLIIAT